MTPRSRTLRRGIVGIEAAIVLIAFVVVAAALAFVALNMGFYTTQRSKEVMAAGLAQASSALEIDGSILAKVDTKSQKVMCMVIPIRVSAGQREVDLTPNKTTIAVWVVGKAAYTNVYYNDTVQAITDITAISSAGEGDEKIDIDPSNLGSNYDIDLLCNLTNKFEMDGETYDNPVGVAIIWGPGSNGDKVLGPGEKALVVINFNKLLQNGKNVESYDVVKVEIKPPIGSSLTIERTMPASLTSSIIDLG